MLAATKVKMSGREKKEQEHVRYFLHKTSNQEVSRCGRAKQGQRMYKKVCCTCKVAFLLIRPIVVFSPFSGVAFAA